MTAYLNSEDIIVDFLRVRLTDPRARAETTNSENFTASVSQTTFSLTAPSGNVQAVTLVQVDGTDQVKWKDYYIDFQNQKVIFFNGLTGGESVDITYKYGTTSWIYSDDPQDSLSATSYPRISVKIIGGTGVRLGQYEAEVESSTLFSADFWAKEQQFFTINSIKYEGQDLARYLASKATEAFELYINDLHPILYNYLVTQVPTNVPRDDSKQAFHTVLTFNMKGLTLGRRS